MDSHTFNGNFESSEQSTMLLPQTNNVSNDVNDEDESPSTLEASDQSYSQANDLLPPIPTNTALSNARPVDAASGQARSESRNRQDEPLQRQARTRRYSKDTWLAYLSIQTHPAGGDADTPHSVNSLKLPPLRLPDEDLLAISSLPKLHTYHPNILETRRLEYVLGVDSPVLVYSHPYIGPLSKPWDSRDANERYLDQQRERDRQMARREDEERGAERRGEFFG